MTKRIFYYTIFLVGFLFIVGIKVAQAVSLPDFSSTTDLPAFISSVYSFALTVVGIAVFIRILYAGFLMLTAAGNASKWGDARTKMQNAVVGAILLFAAYLILYIINPDLVKNTFNFNLPPSSQAPGGAQTVVTPLTSGPAQVRGRPSAGSAFWDKLMPAAKAAGVYSFNLQVIDVNGDSCSQIYSMEVLSQTSALRSVYKMVAVDKSGSTADNSFIAHAESDCSIVNFVTGTIPNAYEGIEYYAEVYAQGGKAPYAYSMTDGELPPGLVLTANTPAAAFIGSASIPKKSVAAPTATPEGGTEPTVTATPAGACDIGNFPSTCSSSGYSWYQDVQVCGKSSDFGVFCTTDSYCVSKSLGSTCWLASNGGCKCITTGTEHAIGPCCQSGNPLAFATLDTAETLASCLGGEVDAGEMSNASYVWNHPQYNIKFSNGVRLNAGAVANVYSRNSHAEADDSIRYEVCRGQ